MPGNGGGPEGPTAGSALCSKGIFPASSRPPCTKRRLSVRLGGGYSAFSAHSCDILSYLIRFPAACQEFLLPILCAWGILALAEGTGGPVCRPYGVLQVAGQRVREAQGPPTGDVRAKRSPSSGPSGHLPPWRGKAFGRPQGSPLRRKPDRKRWLGKARRRSGTAPVLILLLPRPPMGPDGTAPKHS